jgi:hypothetical protein
VSATCQTTTAAISIGLPPASLTLACADSWLRIRVETEQLNDAGSPGDHRGQTSQHEGAGQKDQRADQAQRYSSAVTLAACHHSHRHSGQQPGDAQHQHAQAGQEPGLVLGYLLVRRLRNCGGGSLYSHLALL